jgi:hypothetical protein
MQSKNRQLSSFPVDQDAPNTEAFVKEARKFALAEYVQVLLQVIGLRISKSINWRGSSAVLPGSM